MSWHVGGATIGALGTIAVIEGESGDAELAARLAGAIRAIRAETGEASAAVSVLHLPDPVDVVYARLGPEHAETLMAERAGMTLEEAVASALAGGPRHEPGPG